MSAFEVDQKDPRFLIAQNELAIKAVDICEFLGIGFAHANPNEDTKKQFPLTLSFEKKGSAMLARFILNLLLMPV